MGGEYKLFYAGHAFFKKMDGASEKGVNNK